MPRNVTVTFDDGSTHVYQGVPDDATPDQVEARASQDFAGRRVTALDGGRGTAKPAPAMDHAKRLQDIQAEIQQLEADKPGAFGKYVELNKNFAQGVADTALNLGSQIISVPVAGVAGALTTAATMPFVGKDRAVDLGASAIEKVGGALTIQPQSEVGRQAQANIGKPFEMLAQGADWAGEKTREATGSPALATAVNTVLQAAPAILTRRGGLLSRVEITPSGVRVAPKPVSAGTAAAQAAETARIQQAQATAKSHVGSLGIDWDSLAAQTKAKLISIASEAGDLKGLDDAALARELRLQSLPAPVPATRGQLTRDPVALRNEGNVAATAEGAPIRDIHLAQNQALLDNLDILKGKVSGTGKTAATATTPEQTGAAVQGAARAKLDFQRGKVRQLYEQADASAEGAMPVSAAPLLEWINDPANARNAPFIRSALADYMDEAGNISARNLERIRQEAVAASKGQPSAATHFAGEASKIIDQMAESSGGELYAKARAARKAQGMEFQEQGAVADLVDNASRTDRTTALENTTRAITNGSLEDIRKVKRTLLTGGDEATRTAGKQAWREVRAQVIQGIKDEATKGVSLNPDGSPNLTPAAFKRAIDRYGPQKLDEIFGPGTAKELNRVLEAARDVKTQPPNMIAGSSTVANVLAFLEKGLTKVPLVGGPAVDVARGIGKLKDIGAGARQAKQAAVTPLSELADQAAAKGNRRNTIGTRKQLSPALIPLSQVGERKR